MECIYYHLQDLYEDLELKAMPHQSQRLITQCVLTNLNYAKKDCKSKSFETDSREEGWAMTDAFCGARDVPWKRNLLQIAWSDVPNANLLD